MAGKLFNLLLNQGGFLPFEASFRISLPMKQGQRFGIVCQTQMSATRNSFAASLCMNLRKHRYENVC